MTDSVGKLEKMVAARTAELVRANELLKRENEARKRVEEALRASQDRIASIFRSVPTGMGMAINRIMNEVNDSLCELTGYTKEELIGKSGRMLYPSDEDFNLVGNEKYRQIADRGIGAVETRFKRKDGKIIHVMLSSAPIDPRDLSVGISFSVTDITERKRVEENLNVSHEALKRAEENYRHLFLNATEGIFQTTPEGRFLSVNPALARILGYNSARQLMERVTDLGTQVMLNPHLRSAYVRILNQHGIVENFECRMRRADGAVIWVALNIRLVRDPEGQVLYHEGTLQDITQRKLMSEQLTMQRDLALQLASTVDFGEGLNQILMSAIQVSGLECGGIWLKQADGDFELISSVGLADNFKGKVQRLEAGSTVWSLIMGRKTVYMAPDKDQAPRSHEEGFKFRAIVPILSKGQVIGALNILSRKRDKITEHGQLTLDFLSAQSGNIIARMQARRRLEKEVETRREAERALQAEQINLLEMNAALRVLLKHREDDRKELEERLVSNISQLVLPYLKKLRRSSLEIHQETLLDFIDTNLTEILSPFLDKVQSFRLTGRQTEVITLIKAGRTTKEIARLLNISKAAVDKQRFLIRKRLNLNNEKINLRSYLLSLAE